MGLGLRALGSFHHTAVPLPRPATLPTSAALPLTLLLGQVRTSLAEQLTRRGE